MSDLDNYIQDALDLIEFANGPTSSVWGAKRAALGHPEPFNLKMMGVGNENWDAPYIERYTKFHAVLKEKHPEIKLVSSAGPFPDDAHFKYAWPKLRELHADIIDEHCYAKPDWFFNNTHRFDSYDRNGPKVFFGEYAAQSDKVVSVENRNNLECAIAEAAYMTGLERNGDVVRMASYAPLFANIDAWQWTPNLIWVDNLRSYGTPNYYVQKMFANNPGDETVPLKLDAADGAKLFASATRDTASGELILKIVNGANSPAEIKLDFNGAKKIASTATLFTLSGNLQDENSFTQPEKIAPKETSMTISAPPSVCTFPANSLTVMRLKITN
jgi:alpha-N-arabinofuranosidase